MKDNIYYILDEKNNVIPSDWISCMRFIQNIGKKILKQDKINGKLISTVFLGIDHSFDEKELHVFETMIFNQGEWSEEYCDRYSTFDSALIGHQKAIDWLKSENKENE